MPKMIEFQDEPIADPVCMPLYFVSKLAKDNGVSVCQVGEGADELFIGYPSWLKHLKVNRVSSWFNNPLSRAALRSYTHLIRDKKGYKVEYVRRLSRNQNTFWGGAGAFTELEKSELAGPQLSNFAKNCDSYDVVKPIWDRFQQNAWEATHVNWLTYMDMNLRLPELLLMRVDKMSMATSVEARVPFLDHEFVTTVLSIPSDIRYRPGESKPLLKKSVSQILPREIISRPKQGFGIPLNDWLISGLITDARKSVVRFCENSGILDTNIAMEYLERGETARIWSLYNLSEWWLKNFD
jgi:asparagine synthase (glutamine-hydrolysing)